ncbi:hypothetical protein OG840_61500 [Streptomyces sp. NBC_01764]|uniref:hypothetical protein n=1 Tax=Streptomyces sp. NBC_01764 TaxID=2975935 RepID=UPI00224F2889|nr:hypothetical protein [Streptomyces sp. NBC_01764]MCX4411569.1 hypothetical protein [Streptomyces sp. NBC_01764]
MEPLAATDWWMVGTNFGVAVGTLSAVGVALVVAVREDKRRNLEQAEARAAQAKLVTSTTNPLTISNHSGLTVLSVEILRTLDDRDQITWWNTAQHGPLRAGDIWQFDPQGRPVRAVLFRFMDAAGVHWLRKDNDPPEQLTETVQARLERQFREATTYKPADVANPERR